MGSSPDIKRIRAIVKAERVKMRDKAANGCFFSFIHYVNPRYRANWHHRLLAHTLEDFYRDPNRKRLMVFMPPQHGKSEQASRLFPAYVLGMNPNCKIAACSYAADLARAFNRDVQRIMDATPNYCEIFPDTRLNSARVAADSRGGTLRNTKETEKNMVNNYGGARISTSTGGTITGKHGHVIIEDDPMKPMEAASDAYRKRANDFSDRTLSSRKKDKRLTPRILVMQRLHEDDTTGARIAKGGKIRHICLPAEISDRVSPKEARKLYSKGLLDPVRMPMEVLEEEKVTLGSYGYAGHFDQRPSPGRWWID
jgi:hypothetical protein